MISEKQAIKLLKFFLLALFILFTVLQTLSFPGQFRYMAQTSPNDAHLRWPLTFAVGFVFLCAQVVIISIWKIMTLIEQEKLFSQQALVWFDRIMYSIGGASLLPIGALCFLFIYGDDPGLPMVMFTLLTFLTVLLLITRVLKARTEKVISLLEQR